MAKLGSISLADPEGKLNSGAAFLLAGSSRASETLEVCGTGQITILAANPYLVVRHAAKQPDQLYEQGFELAQQGLDLLSVTGKADLTLRDFSEEYVAWWPVEKGQALRITSTAVQTADVRSPVSFTPAPPPQHHRHHTAFRYYRLSQVTNDLQDAVRNVYLAFELMLSDRYPMEQREKEYDWLKRALMDLAQDPKFLAALGKPANEFADHFIDQIYRGARLPLFHAKTGREYYPPQAVANERLVLSSAFEKLTKLVLRMFESWYNVGRMGGLLNPRVAYEAWEKFFSGAKMVVSGQNVLDRAESDLNHPRFKDTVTVETRLVPHRSADEGPLIIAEFDKVALANAGTIRLFELIKNETVLMGHLFDVDLETSGIDHLEWHCRMRLENAGQPKRWFKG